MQKISLAFGNSYEFLNFFLALERRFVNDYVDISGVRLAEGSI